jgi:hypothetical protein
MIFGRIFRIAAAIVLVACGIAIADSLDNPNNVAPPRGGAPSNTVLPMVIGIGQFGQQLTATNGTWTGSPSSYTYQWLRNGTSIGSATAQTYFSVLADIGQQLTISVTAVNGSGSATASSTLPPFGLFTSTLGGAPYAIIASGATSGGVCANAGQALDHAYESPDLTHVSYTTYYTSPCLENNNPNNTSIETIASGGGGRSILVAPVSTLSNTNPSWFGSSNNNQLIYKTSAGLPGSTNSGIAVYTISTASISLFYSALTSDVSVSDPRSSDDATFVVMAGVPGTCTGGCPSNTPGNIYIVTNPGKVRTQITSPIIVGYPTTTFGGAGDHDPIPNHEQTKVAANREYAPGLYENVIVTLGAGLTAASEITLPHFGSVNSYDQFVQWSSDDALLIFEHFDPQNRAASGVYTMTPSGSNITLISAPAEFSYTEPGFNPGSGSSSSAPIIYSGQQINIFDAPPVNTALPTISGNVQVGQVLTVTPGTWTVASGTTPTITHQLLNEGLPISGATGLTYTVQASDIGGEISVEEIASNSGGVVPATSILTAPVIGATVFYVDNVGGNDSNNGQFPVQGTGANGPWATIAKVNAQTSGTLVPGTSVLFKRGDTWRINSFSDVRLLPAVAGTSGNPIVFDAYGTGPNPVFQGSVNVATTGDWTSVGTNLWQSTKQFPPTAGHTNGLPDNNANDIGNIIWNTAGVISAGTMVGGPLSGAGSGYSCGTAGDNSYLTCGPPASAGQWWFYVNSATGTPCTLAAAAPCWTVQVYSVGNPGNQSTTTMPNLELAQDKVLINGGQNYNTFQNITLQYGAGSAILTLPGGTSANNITFRDLTIQWIGGGNLAGAFTRYGDAYDIEGLISNIVIERNFITEIFDTGPSGQPASTTGTVNSVVWRNNIIALAQGNLFYQYEPGGASTFSNFNLYNNTNYSNATWSIGQHTNGILQYGMWYDFGASNTNVTLSGQVWENNIWSGLDGAALFQHSPLTLFSGILTSDYNNWSRADGTAPDAETTDSVGSSTMAAWAAALSPPQETHGLIQIDPDFTNQSVLNLLPAAGSPLRSAGNNLSQVGVIWDFYKQPRPVGGPFTIGAIECN